MKPFIQYILEKAPPSKKAEEWIKKNKENFKDQYGDDWEQVLYATAWKMFGEKSDIVESEAPTNVSSGVAQADAPMFKKSRFAGYPCVEVDSDTYVRCSAGKGKVPYDRWKKYIEDSELEEFIKKEYHKEKKLLMKNRDTGSMTFIK